jgi:hypothetical protein
VADQGRSRIKDRYSGSDWLLGEMQVAGTDEVMVSFYHQIDDIGN